MIDLQVQHETRRKPRRTNALGELALAPGLARGVGELVEERVAEKGKPVQPFARYKSGVMRVSPRYPIVAQGKQAESGAIIYPSGEAFHANTTRGGFSVSGGMWAGMTVLGHGDRARIVFRGRSEGQQAVYSKPRADGSRTAKGRKVSNALKAATVLQSTAVNVLDNTPDERRAMAEAVEELTRRAVDAALPVVTTWSPRPLSRAARAILKHFGGRR
uniref:Tail protein n=1 Tax=viral metagenome TaxID=1070528 RepID=A0A6M3KPE1_9ZZZZ